MPPRSRGISDPPRSFKAVTPANSDLEYDTRGLYVGVAGDVAVLGEDDEEPVIFTCPAGTTLIGRFKQVRSTSTTASGIVALL